MAIEESVVRITLPAAGDLSASQFKFMKVNASGQATNCGLGEAAVGVLQDDPRAAGRPAVIAISGVAKVRSAATLAAGAAVSSDADGDAIAPLTGHVILGTVIVGGASGEIISVLFQPRNAQA